jgi:hypothetical protein
MDYFYVMVLYIIRKCISRGILGWVRINPDWVVCSFKKGPIGKDKLITNRPFSVGYPI